MIIAYGYRISGQVLLSRRWLLLRLRVQFCGRDEVLAAKRGNVTHQDLDEACFVHGVLYLGQSIAIVILKKYEDRGQW